MLVLLVVLLAVTNAVTLAVVVAQLRRPAGPAVDHEVQTALESGVPSGAAATRRIISVEILNPIELAATRGRVAGLAGSLAPGLTRRVVYDQTVKVLRQRLVEERVMADVRVHTVRQHRAAEPTTEVVGGLDLDPEGFADVAGPRQDERPQPPV